MEDLQLEFQQKLLGVSKDFERYLLQNLDLNNRLIAIKGARGAGKTTLLLQLAKFHLPTNSSLYVSLDHIYFYDKTLFELAKTFELFGGKFLLLDEVHKYPNWSREIKLIYDTFPNLKVIFTSSSLLQIYKSESDLSRRAVSYHLKELSFREFIELETKQKLPFYSFEDILNNHQSISNELLQSIKPLALFDKYLKIGAYPYFIENEDAYSQKLLNTINLVIETDINAIEDMSFDTLVRLKKLLIAVASSAPFTPNISKLSEKIGLTRNSLVHAIKVLCRANLMIELYKNTKGIGVLTKPEKLYLHNTNLMYTLAKVNTNVGNIRETFFLNQFTDVHQVHLSQQADFLINQKYTFEIGGKSKTRKQISGVSDAYIAKDGIEIGFGNVIPIWLFGFMY
ncbi:ATP-binding protein [Psychroflexus planctonicus]|uniref:ATPase AAA n=1 Tax=Psychroflexus planctonicus TaxID=1526575 RepID=A0ABQ1SEX5_9FLAO|nr:AAA family ATPase [Psychroflexus planctonicus]GGE35236.1 ATPase AAA [Psychroflexus planctonicus]